MFEKAFPGASLLPRWAALSFTLGGPRRLFLLCRKWRGHATVLPSPAPANNSWVSCRLQTDTGSYFRRTQCFYLGSSERMRMRGWMGSGKGLRGGGWGASNLGNVVYRGYVHGIAIRRTKGRAWPLPSALLFRCRCSRHAGDTNCRPDSRQGRIAPFPSKLRPGADYRRRISPQRFGTEGQEGGLLANPFHASVPNANVCSPHRFLPIEPRRVPVSGMMPVKWSGTSHANRIVYFFSAEIWGSR